MQFDLNCNVDYDLGYPPGKRPRPIHKCDTDWLGGCIT